MVATIATTTISVFIKKKRNIMPPQVEIFLQKKTNEFSSSTSFNSRKAATKNNNHNKNNNNKIWNFIFENFVIKNIVSLHQQLTLIRPKAVEKRISKSVCFRFFSFSSYCSC